MKCVTWDDSKKLPSAFHLTAASLSLSPHSTSSATADAAAATTGTFAFLRSLGQELAGTGGG